MVTQVLKVLLSMSEIWVNIFKDGTVFFPCCLWKKWLNLSLTLISFNGIYLFSQLSAYCLWTCLVTPHSCLLMPSLNAEGQTRAITRQTMTAQHHPRRGAIRAIYFPPVRSCRRYHDYLKARQRGEVTCPRLHGWWTEHQHETPAHSMDLARLLRQVSSSRLWVWPNPLHWILLDLLESTSDGTPGSLQTIYTIPPGLND